MRMSFETEYDLGTFEKSYRNSDCPRGVLGKKSLVGGDIGEPIRVSSYRSPSAE